MLRTLSIPTAIVAISFGSVCGVNFAYASPGDSGNGSCSFVLTPPTVVQVSSTHMVLATVKPGPCTMEATPNESVVCLTIAGDGSQGQCGNTLGSGPASTYSPYRPGATYVVTGQGCADVFDNPATHSTTGPVTKICQAIGPTSFTL